MGDLFATQQQILAALFEEVPLDEKLLKKHRLLSAEESIAVYRDSSIASLIKTLRETYHICLAVVGDEFFNAMAAIYVKNTPSHSPNIIDYGETFPAFVATFSHAQQLPYLSDVARLEWSWHRAFYGRDGESFDPEILKTLSEGDYPDIVFSLPPSATLVASDYPLDDIWALHQEGSQGSEVVNLDKGGVKLFVWRQDMQVRIETLDEDEWLLLSAIQRGMSMDRVADLFLTHQREEYLPNILADFVRRGCFCSS